MPESTTANETLRRSERTTRRPVYLDDYDCTITRTISEVKEQLVQKGYPFPVFDYYLELRCGTKGSICSSTSDCCQWYICVYSQQCQQMCCQSDCANIKCNSDELINKGV
ncbi:hypothetical protein GJ496_009872 [Pomphorhynchus laevis]|nr:hypothetical protein GJ496_009872 [Pomphorhynchus laevis]